MIKKSANISKEELLNMLDTFSKVFDIVRVVDSRSNYEFTVGEDGELLKNEYKCYAVWNKGERCSNCISAKCLVSKETITKFEFVNNEVFFVMSKYLVYKNEEYTMEMVRKIDDDVLFSAYGKNEFIKMMNRFNDKIYRDDLTGAFNRRYFNEQSLNMGVNDAVAMIDLDHFKYLNDTFGHLAGDEALKKFSKFVLNSIRTSDRFIRLGGDEFVLILANINLENLSKKLELIREGVCNLRLEDYPDARLTASIGAVCYDREIENLLEVADNMLYVAKKKRNNVQIYT